MNLEVLPLKFAPLDKLLQVYVVIGDVTHGSKGETDDEYEDVDKVFGDQEQAPDGHWLVSQFRCQHAAASITTNGSALIVHLWEVVFIPE